MQLESILLIWFLATAAFALGWAVRHWLHRDQRHEGDAEGPPPVERSNGDLEGPIDLRDGIDLREQPERARDRDA